MQIQILQILICALLFLYELFLPRSGPTVTFAGEPEVLFLLKLIPSGNYEVCRLMMPRLRQEEENMNGAAAIAACSTSTKQD